MASVVPQSAPAGGFEFVIQQTDQYHFSKETKTRIRKQAMKAVGESRRQSGRYGQSNLLQLPPGLARNDEPPADARTQQLVKRRQEAPACKRGKWRISQSGTDNTRPANQPFPLSPPMPLSGLQAVMRDYGIDLNDLSALTAIHIGPVASRIFATQPSKLPRLMAHPQASYIHNAQSRYGHYSCLDDAIICLSGKAQYLLTETPRISAAKVLSSYSRAISSLSAALSDPKRWLDPEVLCATEMLALVELLESGSPGDWSPHISGAARLLRARGPQSYKTEFERNLFMGLIGPMVCEAFLNNEACFLEEESWRNLMDELVQPDKMFSDFCPVSMELGRIWVGIPGFVKRVTDTVLQKRDVSESELNEIIAEARQYRQKFMSWRNTFDMAIIKHPEPKDPGLLRDKRLEHLATYFVSVTIIGRIIQAVSPSQREILEDEVLIAAKEIEKLEAHVSTTNFAVSFYLCQKSLMADAAVATSKSWRNASYSGLLIESTVFEEWCQAMHRKTT